METVRNFINISGLANEHDLPESFGGQIIQYSEADVIFIPDNQPDIRNVFQVIVQIEKKSVRLVRTPAGNTLVIDGFKKLKIIYTQNEGPGKATFLDLELPYNTFVELQSPALLEDINIYILDAYFSRLDKRRIYSHFVYMVCVSAGSGKQPQKQGKPVDSSKNEKRLPESFTDNISNEVEIQDYDFEDPPDYATPDDPEPDDGSLVFINTDAEYL